MEKKLRCKKGTLRFIDKKPDFTLDTISINKVYTITKKKDPINDNDRVWIVTCDTGNLAEFSDFEITEYFYSQKEEALLFRSKKIDNILKD